LKQRAITGIVFVGVLMGGILFHPFAFLGVFGLIVMLTLYEFYGLIEKDGKSPQKLLGTAIGTLFFASTFLVNQEIMPLAYLVGFIPIALFFFLAELFRKKENPYTGLAYTILGFFYIALPFSSLSYLINNPVLGEGFHYEFLLAFFVLIWTGDTGAYLVGSQIGKRKLFERISPKKSWEGSIGGVICAMGVSWIFSIYFTQINLWQWFGFAIIAVTKGTYGDLVESLFKRKLGIKDSGTILPGHGGMLDRFDSAILAAPAIFTYIYIIANL